MNINPATVAAARTARLVREAQTPVFVSTREGAEARARRDLRARAEREACTNEYCFICKRATEHFGEHSDEQILAWARSPQGRRWLS